MARIIDYQMQSRPQGAIDARRISGEDLSSAGAMVGFGQAVSQTTDILYKRAEQIEVSDVAARMAESQDAFNDDFHTRLKDPKYIGDPNFKENFLKDYDAHMEKLQEGLTTGGGRQYFEQTNARMKHHFSEMAISGQTELAGIKAKDNYTTFYNKISSSIYKSPSSYHLNMELLDNHLNTLGSAHNLDSKLVEDWRLKGKTELTKMYVEGWTAKDPNKAKEILDSKAVEHFLGGELVEELYAGIEREKTARRNEADRMEAENEKRLKKEQDTVLSTLVEKLHNNELSKADVFEKEGKILKGGTKDWLMNKIGDNARKKFQNDPSVEANLLKRIYAKDGDPNKIAHQDDILSSLGDGLDSAGFGRLVKALDDSPEGKERHVRMSRLMAEATTKLVRKDPMGLTQDPQGDAMLSNFHALVLSELAKAKAGKTSGMELLDASGPKYLGKLLYTSQFKRDDKAIMEDMTSSLGGKIAPRIGADGNIEMPEETRPGTPPPKKGRMPGESAKDYLQRIKN